MAKNIVHTLFEKMRNRTPNRNFNDYPTREFYQIADDMEKARNKINELSKYDDRISKWELKQEIKKAHNLDHEYKMFMDSENGKRLREEFLKQKPLEKSVPPEAWMLGEEL